MRLPHSDKVQAVLTLNLYKAKGTNPTAPLRTIWLSSFGIRHLAT